MTEAPSSFAVEILANHHARDNFDCGKPPLDEYIRKQAGQDTKKKLATTYVLVAAGTSEVIGYFSLAATGVPLDSLPEEVAKKLPRYPTVPATLLGRLAIAKSHHGRRLGERLLLDALHRSLQASEQVGSMAVFVEAIDDQATEFYTRYGFVPLPDQPLRLFLTMKKIRALFA